MRLSVASLRRMVKRPLHVEFTRQQLTSYSGLELLRRYLRQLDLPQRLRTACAATGGDYGGGRLALLVLSSVMQNSPLAVIENSPPLPLRRERKWQPKDSWRDGPSDRRSSHARRCRGS